jgi:hypothetical protein
MPFGKHKGEPFEELPDGYLEWALGNINAPDVRKALEAEWRRRNGSSSAPGPLDAPARQLAQELLAAGFKALARERHPDRGGTHEQQVALGKVRDWLRSVIERGA